jgi:hypothetical protein
MPIELALIIPSLLGGLIEIHMVEAENELP